MKERKEERKKKKSLTFTPNLVYLYLCECFQMRSIDIDYCRNKIRQEKTKKKEKKIWKRGG